ncbi:MAG: hypothetical protein OEW77_11625 [Gemmatimonadota bacterium]|nr:hypothetical protein [Gemmatimonadota bacterium]
MRPLCAARVAALVVLALGGRAAAAQDGWNDARTRELVLAAIERRAVQLADTGLADYTARAHGYITFLAQLGEGFPDPPAVIKSDELMVEVYWGAPDRSKQRIIGRRDTLLLPTDINYHRDHLGVVQNNFPAIIRLGDGDEVRDVPHPLSAAGLATYDYRVVDSLAIRAGDRAIDVMMVSVRPKDDRQPAAVGAVYIDRVTSSVVRMTLSFTRAALKDRQLEDVSVILENGLVDGRFWLPRRQEIEIRRTATWMDFPARGIIRGRWEICCVETNAGLAPATFRGGPEITEAPRELQRAYAFTGSILSGLPAEVRAFDAAEVRRVQESARELVRAGALARTRKTALAARGLSDFVRVNRAEGLALGLGVTRQFGAGVAAKVTGRYGTADRRGKVSGSVGWTSAAGRNITLGARNDFATVGIVPEVSGLRNSLAAQEFGSDWTDLHAVRGVSITLGLRPRTAERSTSRFTLEFAHETQRPLAVAATPVTGSYEPAFPAMAARVQSVGLGWVASGQGEVPGTRWRATLRLEGARVRDPAAGGSGLLARTSVDLEARRPVAGGALDLRTVAGAVTPGTGIPSQFLVFFGGPVTGPGYSFHSIAGRLGVSQRVEYQLRIPFVSLNLGRFGRVPSSLVAAPFLQGVWLSAGPVGKLAPFPSVGLGVLSMFDVIRVDAARTLRGNGWLFSVDVSRDFWKVM